MRSDARKRTEATALELADAWAAEIKAEALAPIVDLATRYENAWGLHARNITPDALWAAIAVARGEQS